MYHWTLYFVALPLLLTYAIIKIHNKLNYFSKWGIPHPRELPIIGMIHLLFYPRRRHVNDLMKYIYNVDKKAKYIGGHIFFGPVIFVRDLDLIKQILVKNFDHFTDRKSFVDENADPLFGKNLNFLNGDRWRELRNVLSPSFTSSKMRLMYVLMSDCAERFSNAFVKTHTGKDIDVKDAFTRYTNDVIASCAFGIEVDSINEPDNEFYLRAKEVMVFKV